MTKSRVVCFQNRLGSSAIQCHHLLDSSSPLTMHVLRNCHSSGHLATDLKSPLDPGSYLDAASETLRSLDIARPHSPSQSPLSTYFKTSIPTDVPMAESWTHTRTRPDSSSTRECLPWSDSYGVPKPTAQSQHAKQKALRIAVVNRQISSVELLK